VLVIGRDEIRQAVTILDAIDSARVAFTALATGEANVPPRPHLSTPGGTMLIMPAFSPGVGAVAVKIVSVMSANPERGLPTVQGLVILVDGSNGRALALIEGTFLTQLRTGAAIGLAADLLSRANASTVAVFGAGATAQTSLWATCAVRNVREVRVVHPHANHFPSFVAAMRDFLGDACPPLARWENPNAAVEGADIVITATTSPTPVFSGDRLTPGAFVAALGAYRPTERELDDTVIRGARLVVDTRAGALSEAGDLAIPIARGSLSPKDIWAELGEIIVGSRPGRTRSDDVIAFKSVGNAMQDLALATVIHQRALSRGLGRDVAL
jgi:ornithine cyclodeaminase/alanine dehydrogenase-like protein (mu-crystallin family)